MEGDRPKVETAEEVEFKKKKRSSVAVLVKAPVAYVWPNHRVEKEKKTTKPAVVATPKKGLEPNPPKGGKTVVPDPDPKIKKIVGTGPPVVEEKKGVSKKPMTALKGKKVLAKSEDPKEDSEEVWGV